MKNKLQMLCTAAVLASFMSTLNAQVVSSSASVNAGNSALTPNQNNSDAGKTALNLLAPPSHGGKRGKQPLGNAFSGDIFNVSIGFVSGIGDIYTASSLSYVMPVSVSNSPSPAFALGYEHALSHAIGVGLNVGYQSATTNFSTVGWSYSPATGAISTYKNSYTYSLSMPTFMLRGAFHFTAGTKIDPYAGINIGYCLVSTSQSFKTNDPNFNTPTDYNASLPTPVSLSGVAYGVFIGGRYFFTDQFGAWLELSYANVTLSSFHLNVNVNPTPWIKLGVCVKI